MVLEQASETQLTEYHFSSQQLHPGHQQQVSAKNERVVQNF